MDHFVLRCLHSFLFSQICLSLLLLGLDWKDLLLGFTYEGLTRLAGASICNKCQPKNPKNQVGTEAAFHPVEEYMKYVEEWFRLVDLFRLTVSQQHIISTPMNYNILLSGTMSWRIPWRPAGFMSHQTIPRWVFATEMLLLTSWTGAWGVSEEVSWDRIYWGPGELYWRWSGVSFVSEQQFCRSLWQ